MYAGRFAWLTITALLISNANSTLPFWAYEAIVNIGRRAAFERLADQIPPTAPLACSLNLGPHLLRRQFTIYPVLQWPAETFPNLATRRAEHVLVDYRFEQRHRATKPGPQETRLAQLGYELVQTNDSFAWYQLRETHADKDVPGTGGPLETRIIEIEEQLRAGGQ